jgi:hypothetical protein
MGRIIELFPGKDGESRVAKVKTSTGVLIRPLQRLYPLEVTSSSEFLPVPETVKKVAVQRKKKVLQQEENNSQEQEPEVELQTRSGRRVKRPARLNE